MLEMIRPHKNESRGFHGRAKESPMNPDCDVCLQGHPRERIRSASGLHILACPACEIEVIWRECLSEKDKEFLKDAGVDGSVLTREQLKSWLRSILPKPNERA